jgi:hypothetical protein
LLLSAEADVNVQTNDGKTTLEKVPRVSPRNMRLRKLLIEANKVGIES